MFNKNKLSYFVSIFAGAAALTAMSSAQASMGNLGSTYGVLPADLATAQALSMFNSHTSSLYYNPAALVKDPRGELSMGLMHVEHDLKMNGNTILNAPSQQVLVGMKTNLTSLTKFEHPLYFGMILGIEKYGKEMMSFESQTSASGQFLEYGRQPLFMVMGGGTKIWRGIDAGFSARVTLHSDATLNASSDLGGNTQYEEMEVSAKQKLTPIAGININWGQTLAADKNSWLNNFETAFNYRGFSNTQTKVASNITIPGTVGAPGMPIAVTTLDSYQPNIYSLGFMYQEAQHYRVGLTLEYQQWSKLEEELRSDSIKDQAVKDLTSALEFNDILVPRLGGEYWLSKTTTVSAGLAYSPATVASKKALDVNYLDNDKVILGLGLGVEFPNPPVLAYPMRFDIGYQYHNLVKQNFELYNTGLASQEVSAKGSVHAFSAAVTLKF